MLTLLSMQFEYLMRKNRKETLVFMSNGVEETTQFERLQCWYY
jgi:sRNA-binding regulator protein Hfq